MIIKNQQQLKKYRSAGRLSTKILRQLHQAIEIGKTPLEIDALADQLCQKYQVRPNFKGVGPKHNPYQYATCIAVNEVVVHGIPDQRPFKAGDIIKLDFGIEYQGLNTDHCFTLGLGKLSKKERHLIKTSQVAIQKAASQAVAGKRTGDLGYLIQSTVEKQGLSVVKEFIGHGIGNSLHEEPQLPAYGQPGTGQVLKPGMVLCVEAQILAGSDQIYIADDGWTVKTEDGSKSAMFEYMVVVGEKEPEYLTKTLDWAITAD